MVKMAGGSEVFREGFYGSLKAVRRCSWLCDGHKLEAVASGGRGGCQWAVIVDFGGVLEAERFIDGH